MSTSTTRLGLVKPAVTEDYDVSVFNANADKADAAVGRTVCTSTTRPSSPYLGQQILETDTGNQLTRTATNWFHEGVPVVAALTDILLPYTGQRVFLTTDNTMYQRTATPAWLPWMPGPAGTTAATRHEGAYAASVAQAITNGLNTPVAFATTSVDTALVTKATSGVGHSFTLTRAGIWAIEATVRYASVAVGGERYAEIVVGSTVLQAQGANAAGNTSPITLNVGVEERLASGSVMTVRTFQGTGSSQNLDAAWTRVTFTWIRG